MVSFLRTLLAVLLALPAVAIPPGMTLEWCLCSRSACCSPDRGADDDACAEVEVTCCGTPIAPCDDRSDGETLEKSSCPSCQSVDVEPFEPGLESAKASLEIAPPAAIAQRAEPPAPMLSRVVAFVASRAPPGAVRPAGLLPGAQPLLR